MNQSTLFEEYFHHGLWPFVHYLPVLLDLSNIVQQAERAKSLSILTIQPGGNRMVVRMSNNADVPSRWSPNLRLPRILRLGGNGTSPGMTPTSSGRRHQPVRPISDAITPESKTEMEVRKRSNSRIRYSRKNHVPS
ncbi:hypothetical protein B0H14DRAFT_2632213 [Mycena olivaceomarginata]|nr:hypothetical protein B0H14DRAFT_2632213 [Mycena olivaceomarginata]